ncbi:MAG: hypothetical protein L0Z62_28360 [Gemmataceae bacterium]|nr:hypothetical protein [Gemmataceae bacterium]
MFEVIISAVNTGRVQRKVFETPEQADAYIDRFMHGGFGNRNPRNYRVEVHTRLTEHAPTLAPVSARAVSSEVAA